MKKLTLVLALALVLGLASSAVAAPFTDVPAGHWAEEALKAVVEAGVITGFPDGSFRGTDYVNRYQLSIALSRLMDWVEEVAAEQPDLARDLRTLRGDLMTLMGEVYDLEFYLLQLQDDVEDLEVMLDTKYLELEAQVEEMMAKGLSDRQAEEVLIMIRALTQQYRHDIDDLYADMELLGIEIDERFEDMEAQLAEIAEPSLHFTVRPTFNYSLLDTGGPGDPWTNPFTHWRADTWNLPLASVQHQEHDTYDYALPIGIHGRTDKVDMDLNLRLDKDALTRDVAIANWGGLTGTVSTEHVTATFAENQGLALASYLFAPGWLADRGAVVTFPSGKLGILHDTNFSYMGSDYSFDLLGILDNTLFLGTQDMFNANAAMAYVVGLRSQAGFGPVALTLDLASSDFEAVDFFTTVTLDVDLGLVLLNADYTYVDDFVALLGNQPNEGYQANITVPFDPLELTAFYVDKAVNRAGGAVSLDSLTFGPVSLQANADYQWDFGTDAMHLDERFARLDTELGFVSMFAQYDHLMGPGRPTQRQWWNRTGGFPIVPVAERHNVQGGLNASLFDMLTLGANATYHIETDVTVITGNLDLTPFNWFTAGANAGHNLATDTTWAAAQARLAPDPYGLMGFSFQPEAGVRYNIMDQLLNYDVGLTASRQLWDNLAWNTSARWDYREQNLQAVGEAGFADGRWSTIETGLEYCGIANISYEFGDYESLSDDTRDYFYQAIKAGISLSF